MSVTTDNLETVTLKFSIKRFLNDLGRGKARNARRELAKKWGISYHRLIIISNTEEGSTIQIGSDKLRIIADYFGTTTDDILRPYEEERTTT